MTVVDDLEPRLASGIIKYVGNTGDIEASRSVPSIIGKGEVTS